MAINLYELNTIAKTIGYDSYDAAILTMYFDKGWSLPPIANLFKLSTTTIKKRIVYHHNIKLKPKGGKRKSCHAGIAPVEKPIPVKSRWRYEDCENNKPCHVRGGNSIWHQGARA